MPQSAPPAPHAVVTGVTLSEVEPVAGVHYAHAAAEVDQPVAVGIGEHRALRVDDGDGRNGRDPSRHRRGTAGQQSAALRAWDLGPDLDDTGHRRLERHW
jgi:hypothetical protein